ncbi:MAG: hypothetical protein A3B91_01810 [Candidatus Yanofskybacteria bacterium RIFCSPHIGHO2_02_FULL_41_29]|uniref:Pyridoxamine 5'-phosphate oxidase N-terminal domain-containing protein n=1 Tax=Candidatus Yanofskybacteria bacterium RIFCSPHIGHO2_01_FULL_41_53 TaxID=1802663 RepID=A0A1F8EH23_9BACT|nr:MAG: hypothetical protein A2650_04250 [Candidatus Yanofskybacteria bacterium RIFCSPHIGHO2_01_FULL_41_53]OGN11197.1 MAG: hypothetical protein A3B91_01810 [Candidatus Yanofskybacteria bacterium RIFCSPHIGHO2_02_FULL_41_29]OGN16944.1 MAG: hypothetical protein A3F48_00805 [Candidatus Yanofskybacteria bacterium RIFCSPHIGHO2_12_FULL_41_9]OGN22263.1 MAG: hypothetical protein A2916_04055 [Candidatus Yanofskybacteria bacterium RIFCSPLOWO2_01_FULL_41_67]OGN29631.1 MAG: hypothetical protein A3H54_00695 
MSNNNKNNKQKRRELALKVLKKHNIAIVATASRRGEPQAAVLYYAIDDDFTFNFITDNKSRKWKNLKENPHIAIVVDAGPGITTIQCGGHANLIDYIKDTNRAEKIIRKVLANSKLYDDPLSLPVLISGSVEYGIFTVKPEWMILLNLETNKTEITYSDDYIKVLP